MDASSKSARKRKDQPLLTFLIGTKTVLGTNAFYLWDDSTPGQDAGVRVDSVDGGAENEFFLFLVGSEKASCRKQEAST